MNLDPRLNTIVAAQPYPLLFATISGAHLYGFGLRLGSAVNVEPPRTLPPTLTSHVGRDVARPATPFFFDCSNVHVRRAVQNARGNSRSVA